MQSTMLWIIGALFLLMAPMISHRDGRSAEALVRYVLIILGALCVRFA